MRHDAFEQVALREAAESAGGRFVRVPAERLDALIQQVGELAIAGATADVLARETRHPRLQETLAQLTQLIDTLQSGSLQLRMMPIGETFGRCQALVDEAAQRLGQPLVLEIAGGDTELDKAMLERIDEPLRRLLQHAIVHGLESAAARAAARKPATGRLRLAASHDAGTVVVEVGDDGRGLDREQIAATAIERGLIAGADGLSDHDVFQLIFEPGYADNGLAAVKQAIEALRGEVSLQSSPGAGTTVQLRLPLTLAVIDGFMVGVGDSRFIVPLDSVVECIELPPGALDGDAHYIDLRGQVLPFVSLREAFGVPGQPPRRPSVVVVRNGETRSGVLVDSLHGEIQTVIKPMSRIFRHLRAVSGTSILGSGDIALILDVHALVQRPAAHAA